VRDEIFCDSEEMKNGDILIIQSESGTLLPQPWGIKILEELPKVVSGQPWENVFKVIGRSK